MYACESFYIERHTKCCWYNINMTENTLFLYFSGETRASRKKKIGEPPELKCCVAAFICFTGHQKNMQMCCRCRMSVPGLSLTLTYQLSDTVRLLTLSQYNSFVSWELCLDWLRGEVLSALPQVPFRAAKTTKPPEVSPVAPCCFRESVLHAGELLRSVDK